MKLTKGLLNGNALRVNRDKSGAIRWLTNGHWMARASEFDLSVDALALIDTTNVEEVGSIVNAASLATVKYVATGVSYTPHRETFILYLPENGDGPGVWYSSRYASVLDGMTVWCQPIEPGNKPAFLTFSEPPTPENVQRILMPCQAGCPFMIDRPTSHKGQQVAA